MSIIPNFCEVKKVFLFFLALRREAVDFRFLINRFLRPADVGTVEHPTVASSDGGRCENRTDIRLDASQDSLEAEVGRFEPV